MHLLMLSLNCLDHLHIYLTVIVARTVYFKLLIILTMEPSWLDIALHWEREAIYYHGRTKYYVENDIAYHRSAGNQDGIDRCI